MAHKKNREANVIALIVFYITFLAGSSFADVTLPAIIAENMVLQQGIELPIWGWAEPGEKILIELGEVNASVTAGPDGKWMIKLPAMKYEPNMPVMTMIIHASNTIQLKNILVGEVWVGSGQSNMEYPLVDSIWSPLSMSPPGFDGKQAVAEANFPRIRLFCVPHAEAATSAKDVNAVWKVCSPETVPDFSAVQFFFGRHLHQQLNVPIGLINTCWGGIRIEPWIATDTTNRQGGELYNAMVAPLQPFAIRGIIWYHGEANVYVRSGLKYADMMTDLVKGWRTTWGNEKISFYFAQLAPFVGERYELDELPALWQAQVAALNLPQTGMVVTTDLVESTSNIHPRQKQPVGERFAFWALKNDYGRKDLVCSGPLYCSMKIEDTKIRLYFDHVGSGLASRDGKPLSEFEIAGIDGKFVEATAVIDSNTVVVSAPDVPSPMYVKFAWYKGAVKQNLINQAGLPASPFQTYHWPICIEAKD